MYSISSLHLAGWRKFKLGQFLILVPLLSLELLQILGGACETKILATLRSSVCKNSEGVGESSPAVTPAVPVHVCLCVCV